VAETDTDERYVWELTAFEHRVVMKAIEHLLLTLLNAAGEIAEKKVSRKPGELEARVDEGLQNLAEFNEVSTVADRLRSVKPVGK
jgi:hypothetical protein